MRILYYILFLITVFFLSILLFLEIFYAFDCRIQKDGVDENLYEYLCKVDICLRNFMELSNKNKFEVMWRKTPHNVNWCSTNAQMSIIRFATKHELTVYKVKNMLENEKTTNTTCTAIIISFDGDDTIRNIPLEKPLQLCNIQHLQFSHQESGGLSNLMRNVKPIIDYLVIGPSKSSSYLLFQQFLSDYDHIMPTVCQVNFAYSLPKFTEENGFRESVQKLRTDSKYLLIGSSKDRTDMHLNLFFVNMREMYCRERYLRYFSYY